MLFSTREEDLERSSNARNKEQSTMSIPRIPTQPLRPQNLHRNPMDRPPLKQRLHTRHALLRPQIRRPRQTRHRNRHTLGHLRRRQPPFPPPPDLVPLQSQLNHPPHWRWSMGAGLFQLEFRIRFLLYHGPHRVLYRQQAGPCQNSRSPSHALIVPSVRAADHCEHHEAASMSSISSAFHL